MTAQEMVDSIKSALQANPAGVVSVTVDGQIVQYDRAQALTELRFWQREAAREAGRRPRSAGVYLGGF